MRAFCRGNERIHYVRLAIRLGVDLNCYCERHFYKLCLFDRTFLSLLHAGNEGVK